MADRHGDPNGDLVDTWRLASAIIRDHSLSIPARTVAIAMLDFRNRKTGACYPSHTTLGEAVGLQRRRVVSLVNEILASGWVRVEGDHGAKTGRSTRYSFAFDRLKPVQNIAQVGVQDIAHPQASDLCNFLHEPVQYLAHEPRKNPLSPREKGGAASLRAAPLPSGRRADARRASRKVDPTEAMLIAAGWGDDR
jgi:hypothetical protein